MGAKEAIKRMLESVTGQQLMIAAICIGILLVLLMIIAIVLLVRRMLDAQKHANDVTEAVAEMIAEHNRKEHDEALEQRAQMNNAVASANESMTQLMGELSRAQQGQIDALGGQLRSVLRQDEERMARIQSSMERRLNGCEQRLGGVAENVGRRLNDSQAQLQALCDAMEDNVRRVGEESARQMNQLTRLVDDRLGSAVDRRLEASFASVTERLDEVTRGLADMRGLAGSVEELRGVLTSGAPTGGWGEVQLGALLSQMLAPEQYAQHVKISPERDETADYAVVMPGDGRTVMLPIDSSLPMREYQELVAARQSGTREEMENARGLLESAVRMHARRISERLIAQPYTTDYAVLFLPNEGLFAEVLQLPGLVSRIQQESRMVIAGPTTFAALLSSLQMGFKSMAIRQRTQEITELLSAVRQDLDGFAGSLSRTQRRLRQASESIETAQRHSEKIARRLQDVQELPEKSSLIRARIAEGSRDDAFAEDDDDEPWD